MKGDDDMSEPNTVTTKRLKDFEKRDERTLRLLVDRLWDDFMKQCKENMQHTKDKTVE